MHLNVYLENRQRFVYFTAKNVSVKNNTLYKNSFL